MIPEIEPYNNYTGDGSATQFDFDFYIEDSSQLVVQHTSADGVISTLTKDTDYTINEIGNNNGSYITFPIAGSSYSTLASDEIISLYLTLPIAQESEYGTSSELDLKSLEYSLDYLTRICQIMNRQIIRAAKVPEGSDIDADDLTVNIINVGESIENVDAVAGDLTNINTVSDDLTNIDTVANSITNVDTVGQSIGNVNKTANDLENVDIVANAIDNVNAVADDIQNVNQVGRNIDNVVNVGADIVNVDKVANNLANMDVVANNIVNVNNVGSSIADVNAIAADLENIDDAVENLDAINAAPIYAQNAYNSAQEAAASAASVKTGGQIWVAFYEDDWDLNSTTGKYEYEIDAEKTPAIVAVYKGNWYDKKLIEIDIKTVNGQSYLVSPDAFDGLILGCLTLLNGDIEDTVATEQAAIALAAAQNAVNAKNGILNNAGFIAVSQGITNINNVAADLENIDDVADDLTKINNVADNLANIDTVADNILNINAVKNNETNINAVNSNKNNIDTVANGITNINTVAADITNINSVASDLSNIDAVADDLTNIDAVKNNETNINAVNANKTNIDTVAGGIVNVGKVADDIANVNSVAGDLTNIDAVKNNAANINSVAADLIKIINVANDLTNIDAVADDLANIDAIAGNFVKHYEFTNDTALIPVNGVCTWNITHLINSTQVLCSLIEISTGKEVQRDFIINSNTSVTVKFLAASNIAANTYKVILIGG